MTSQTQPRDESLPVVDMLPIVELKYCKCCDFSNYSEIMLNLHWIEKHATKEEKKQHYKAYCEICDYGLHDQRLMDSHYLERHASKEERKNTYKFYCDQCDVGTSYAWWFNIHNQAHHMKSKK